MNKKKIISLCLAIALVVLAVTGASFAYLTDSKSAENTFTIGNVKIELNEQQVGKDGLEEFEQDKKLMPGTSDVNAVDKIVTVENTGNNDAWVWVDLYIPKALVSKDYPTDESKNALHWNTYGEFNVEYAGKGYTKLAIADGIIDENNNVLIEDMVDVEGNRWYDYKYVKTETIGEIEYVVIRSKMENTLPSGKISLPALAQVYMDWRVKLDADGENYILPDGSTVSVDFDWKIDVKAYAIQADGIDNVDDAIEYYYNNGKALS